MKNITITALLSLMSLSAMELSAQQTINTPLRNGVDFPVYFRKGHSLDTKRVRYPGFKQETLILKKGSVRVDGAKPLECDILFERDVEITMRDGTKIYADVFRPVKDGKYPAIMAWSPYGKEIGGQWLDDMPGRSGVPSNTTSHLEKFEAPDPAYWVNKGYIIVNPDKRGAYSSEGNLHYWGHYDALDGYDAIEWIASQPWSNTKVGMSGNSWLTVSQWFIAAERPPHLAAIAPWEGFSDHFRESSNRGGIPNPSFPEQIIETFASKNLIEDQPKMIVSYPLMNDYWEDKAPVLENIDIPAYVVASYTNGVHTRGTFEGWNRISSKEKWLRVHNTQEWFDYYTAENVADLNKFFDHYLKGENNDWEKTPKVRLSVLNPGGKDIVNRIEDEFPLKRTQYEKLYLSTTENKLLKTQPKQVQKAEYMSTSDNHSLSFTHTFDKETEITGYMKLRVWIEADGNDDMDLSVSVGKLGPDGKSYKNSDEASGVMRVSMRETDPKRSTEARPYYYFRQAKLLKKGEIVPVDIEIWPMGMQYSKGESLKLTVDAYTYGNMHLPFGSAIVEVPAEGYTYMPGEEVNKIKLGGDDRAVAIQADVITPPATHNKGIHRFYTGGKYDSYLYIPVIPKKAAVNK